MKTKILMMTTRQDLQGDIFTLEALQSAQRQFNEAKIPKFVGLLHDSSLPYIGRIESVEIIRADDGHYELYGIQDIFDKTSNFKDPDLGNLVILEGDKVESPMSPQDNEIEKDEITLLTLDRNHYKERENIEKNIVDQVKKTSNYNFNFLHQFNKSLDAPPEVIITFSSLIYAYFHDKIRDAVLDSALQELKLFYYFVQAIFEQSVLNRKNPNKIDTYLFKLKGTPIVQYYFKEIDNPDIIIKALNKDKVSLTLSYAKKANKLFEVIFIQFIYDEIIEEFKLNYMVTKNAKIIGTQEAMDNQTKVKNILLKDIQ
ncbi:hypothetical protein [Leptospira bandrabouensis]|uniref:hypothetical protein n=1 Tax=Leptospira bandrabouensis TaxID=2484903 RepID=UPI001EE8F486|nr:hypothetical protein [Leptospira bandrabouensis]MCG6162027.1 hypothetical protein [Leptospira bandrabouensis]